MTGLRRSVILAGIVALLAACGGPDDARPTASSRETSATATTAPASPGVSSPAAGPIATTTPRTNTPVTPAPAGAGPSPAQLPWTPDPNVPVDAQVSPVCVARGTLVRLTVQTRPKAGIAWQAVYSDNAGGAPKPYGGGYGGNDKGFSNGEGRYASAWTVSPTAPAGPARVDVIVGWNEAWGYDGPTFTVADANGRC